MRCVWCAPVRRATWSVRAAVALGRVGLRVARLRTRGGRVAGRAGAALRRRGRGARRGGGRCEGLVLLERAGQDGDGRRDALGTGVREVGLHEGTGDDVGGVEQHGLRVSDLGALRAGALLRVAAGGARRGRGVRAEVDATVRRDHDGLGVAPDLDRQGDVVGGVAVDERADEAGVVGVVGDEERVADVEVAGRHVHAVGDLLDLLGVRGRHELAAGGAERDGCRNGDGHEYPSSQEIPPEDHVVDRTVRLHPSDRRGGQVPRPPWPRCPCGKLGILGTEPDTCNSRSARPSSTPITGRQPSLKSRRASSRVRRRST
ncbi:hypothetical protein Cus16_2909 [Curtobacterium sp. ER1/6]|nr:hypothetical protein Cus16_2909 [Curtobacterium sp. ER1/6]